MHNPMSPTSTIVLRIREGTGKLTNINLCVSCAHSHIYTDAKGERTHCQEMYDCTIPIHTPVIKCNDYRDKSLPTIEAMREIAWDISPDPRTGKVGFTKPPKIEE